MGLKIDVPPEQVICRSIRNVAAIDFEYARELGCTIRQIATAKLQDGRVYLAVEPSLVPLTSPFASVVGSQNMVVSTGEFGGETTFGGHGAGGYPTAVAVVSDLLQAAGSCGCSSRTAKHIVIAPCDTTNDLEAPQYLRFVVRDQPGIIAQLRARWRGTTSTSTPSCRSPVTTSRRCRSSSRWSRVDKALWMRCCAKSAGFDFLVESPFTMPMVK